MEFKTPDKGKAPNPQGPPNTPGAPFKGRRAPSGECTFLEWLRNRNQVTDTTTETLEIDSRIDDSAGCEIEGVKTNEIEGEIERASGGDENEWELLLRNICFDDDSESEEVEIIDKDGVSKVFVKIKHRVSEKPRDMIIQGLRRMIDDIDDDGSGVLTLPTRNRTSAVFVKEKHSYVRARDCVRRCRSSRLKLLFRIVADNIMKNLLLQRPPIILKSLAYRVVSEAGPHPLWKEGTVDFRKIYEFVDDISALFRCDRKSLGISGSARGYFGGSIVIRVRNRLIGEHEVDYTGKLDATPISLDNQLGILQDKPEGRHAPLFILIVEKLCVMQYLLTDDNFMTTFPCILISGKGQADSATKEFIKDVCDAYPDLRVFMLIDFNPWGIEIYKSYKISSFNHAFASSNSTIKDLKLIGITKADIDRLEIVKTRLLVMSENDRICVDSLSREDWVYDDPEVLEALYHFTKEDSKADIEIFPMDYLCDTLLPGKLRSLGIQGW